MPNALFQTLEDKINQTLHLIETLRMQLKESQERNKTMENELTILRNRQTQWEHSLSKLLRKLDPKEGPSVVSKESYFMKKELIEEEAEAL